MKLFATKVHKHLPSNRWSITQGGKVIGYADKCVMEFVKPHLNPNIKAKNAHKRTVHCWTLGTLVGVTNFTPLKGRELKLSEPDWPQFTQQTVRYNPFKDDTLVYLDGSEYKGSRLAMFGLDGLMTIS